MAGTIVLTTGGAWTEQLSATIVTAGAVAIAGQTVAVGITSDLAVEISTAGAVAVTGQTVTPSLSGDRTEADVWPNGVYDTVSSWSALATAVANAPDGSIIQLANGTYSATSTISTSKGLLIRAQNYTPTVGGASSPGATTPASRSVVITNNVGQMFSVTTGNTYHAGFVGIRFDLGASFYGQDAPRNYLAFSGSGSKVPLVGDCVFEFPPVNGGNPTSALINISCAGGVFWNCHFGTDEDMADDGGGGNGLFTSHPRAWQTASTMGTLDTNGTVNLYIENSTAYNCGTFFDCDHGGRIVVRNSVIDGSFMTTHGFSSGLYQGGRFVELYDNTIRSTATLRNMAGRYYWLRAGTTVLTGNDVANATDTSYGNITLLIYGDTVAPSGSDGAMQPGWGHNGTTDVRDAMYVWSNTGARGSTTGSYDSSWASVTAVASSADDPTGELFVNLGAKPGWTRFTYPHPLRFT